MVNVCAKTILSQSQTQILSNVFPAQIVSAESVKPPQLAHKHVINVLKMPLKMLEYADVKISSINRDLNVSLVVLDALLAQQRQHVPHVKQVQTEMVL